jgi:predicted amidohydrolase YtcJ
MSAMTSVLYRHGRVYNATDPTATAMLITGDRVAWLGPTADAPTTGVDATVDLDGALVTPAFVDAHIHATDTGLTLSGLDLVGVPTPAALLDALAAYCAALPSDAVVLGHGWDDSLWPHGEPPTLEELDRAGGGRLVYLSQISIHSALCSPALLRAVPGAAAESGYDASGWLRLQSHRVAREYALTSITATQRREVQRATLRSAAALGLGALHECAGPGTSDENDLTGLLALAGPGQGLPEVYGYWGELMGAAKAKELGAVGAGGDLYTDGALGARTAHLRTPYVDGPRETCGHGNYAPDEIAAHLVDCARHGVQGGFHAIGDAAISTVLDGFRGAARSVGVERLRAARHRIEHVEILDKAMIAALVEFGIVASVQPAFDRLWGGEHQMYAQRLGSARALDTNPIGSMHGVGVSLAFGSDSPVTPLDPWGTVRAAMWHFNPAYRTTDRTAFAAHTRGGWRAVHRDEEGVIAPGATATFAVWHTPAGLAPSGLPALDPHGPLPECRRTVVRGTTIFDATGTTPPGTTPPGGTLT